MGTGIRRIGLARPLVQIIESVIVGILLENVRVGDRQSKLFQLFVWNGRMQFGAL
jgi:hypothetical protein